MNKDSAIYQAAFELATRDNYYWCDVEFLREEKGCHVFKPVFKEEYKRMAELLDSPQYIIVYEDGYAEWYRFYGVE